MIEKEFHAKPVEELVAGLQTDIEQGLTQREAQDRLRRYGSNELTEKPRPGFLAGINEGLLPFKSEGEDMTAQRLEEERRLMYVGITRARSTLAVSTLRRRKRGRELVAGLPSRFIAEMRLDERKAKAHSRSRCHVHLDEILERADSFENEHLVLMHFSQFYSPDEVRAILQKRCPSRLLERLVVFAPKRGPWPG